MFYLDTSVLLPLFIQEPESLALRHWFASMPYEEMMVSEWGLTEFASALGNKVRAQSMKPAQASVACDMMQALATRSFHVLTPTRRDYAVALELVTDFASGLRAGDALHLAVAIGAQSSCLYTFDKQLARAARKTKLKAANPLAS